MADERDGIAEAMMAQQDGGNDPYAMWTPGMPGGESIYGPGGIQEYLGGIDTSGRGFDFSGGGDPSVGYAYQAPPVEAQPSQATSNIFDQGIITRDDGSSYFNPRLNAGTMGYDPYANPILDPQPPQGWYPDPNSFNGYTPQPINPGGLGADAPWTIPDVPLKLPDVPDWRGPDPIIDPTIPKQGFFDFDPYEGGQSGIPGSYGAPGMFGKRRESL
jgi:hypothetical protein